MWMDRLLSVPHHDRDGMFQQEIRCIDSVVIVLQLYNDVRHLMPNFTVTHKVQVSPSHCK